MMPNFFWPVVNLSILIGVLFYYLRAPLKQFLATRHATLRDEIRGAAERLVAAKDVRRQVEQELGRFDQEVSAMRAQSEAEVTDFKAKVLGQASQVASQIKADADASSLGAQSRLKAELVESLGIDVINRAGRMVSGNLTSDQRRRLRQEFSRDLEVTL